MTFSYKATKYFCNLKTPIIKSPRVKMINPYESVSVQDVVKMFFSKYYKDNKERLFVIGINPGRFGGGLTGISFTDPVALRENCGIENNFGFRKELSSEFIYRVADKYGGAKKFFSDVFLSAAYPFAITKGGKNYNYYDDILLNNKLKDEIIFNLEQQVKFGARNDCAIILGKKNADRIKSINDENNFFHRFIVLEHPRYIMQYKRKKLNYYINKYLKAIQSQAKPGDKIH